MAWVYILECCDGTYYTGSTIGLEQRLAEHQLGLGAHYTAERRPVRLAWSAELPRIDDAFAAEKRIQGWSRAKKRLLIEGRIHDLAGWSARQRRASRDSEPPNP